MVALRFRLFFFCFREERTAPAFVLPGERGCVCVSSIWQSEEQQLRNNGESCVGARQQIKALFLQNIETAFGDKCGPNPPIRRNLDQIPSDPRTVCVGRAAAAFSDLTELRAALQIRADIGGGDALAHSFHSSCICRAANLVSERASL